MNEEHHDFGGTTAIIAYIRHHITPAAAWTAIASLVGMLVIAVSSWVTTQKNITQLQELIAQQQAHEQKTDDSLQKTNDSLHELREDLAGMKSEVHDTKTEVDHQRERWEYMDGVADSPPHARRKRN